MGRSRKHYSGAEKMAILREHLIEQVPIRGGILDGS